MSRVCTDLEVSLIQMQIVCDVVRCVRLSFDVIQTCRTIACTRLLLQLLDCTPSPRSKVGRKSKETF